MIAPIRIGPVTVWPGEAAGKYPDGNQVIVHGGDSIAVFDTPLVSNALPPASGFSSADLVILGHVHEDHMAGLHRLQHAPVTVHHADLAALQSWDGLGEHYGYGTPILDQLHDKLQREFHYAPRPDATGFDDGASWDLGAGVKVHAVHMPGHTAGHSVLFVEPGAVAFIGDIDLSSFGPYYGDATSSLADFRRTLKRVADLPARHWITSHHKGVISSREQFLSLLSAFAARIDARETRLLQLLAERPKTLEELTAERIVYRPEADQLWVVEAERMSIMRHLDELLTKAAVVRHADRYALG